MSRCRYHLGNTYDCPPDWNWQVDAMHDYDLWLVCAGHGRLSCGRTDYELTGGDCFLFRPGARFAAGHSPDRPLQVVAAHFELNTVWPELTEPPGMLLYRHLSRPELTAGLMRLAIADAGSGRQEKADFWIEAAVRSFFEAEDGETVAATADRRRLEALCAEIARHPEKNWTVRDLALKLHYSADHCRRLFLRHTGCAPIEYVIRRRVERACFLLQYTSLPLAEIAGQLNYRNIYYFSRQFRQVTGIPPGRYRQNH